MGSEKKRNPGSKELAVGSQKAALKGQTMEVNPKSLRWPELPREYQRRLVPQLQLRSPIARCRLANAVDPSEEGYVQELTLSNRSQDPLAFKVQTTAQRLFSVKPVAGIIEAGSAEVVTIKLKPSQVRSPA